MEGPEKPPTGLRNGEAGHDLPQDQGKRDGGDWLIHPHLRPLLRSCNPWATG